jgi:hypothetical protein
MDRRRLVVTPAAAALLLVSGSAWAGPPPPPPPTNDAGGEAAAPRNSAPPPPSSAERIEAAPADPLAIDQRTPTTDISSTWSFSRGSGEQAPNYVREVDDDPFFTVNPIGYYQGVSVGGGNLPPYAPKEIGGQSAVMTWAGFERGETSSRVFFQLSASVEPEVSVESARVFIKLPRTSVTVRNNQRPLITKYFKTPVNEVKVSKSGKDLVAVLELRWEVTPTWRFETAANGYRVLIFEFLDAPEDVTPSDESTPATTPPPPPAPPPPPGEPFLPTK